MAAVSQINSFYPRKDNKTLSFGGAFRVNQKTVEDFAGKISKDNLMLHLKKLTSPEMEGRGVGFRGIELAKKYIASEFKKIGLEPFAPLKMKNYFDKFKMQKYDTYLLSSIDNRIDKANPKQHGNLIWESSLGDVETSNILGMIKGKRYPQNYLFITAHYDHLGKSEEGVIFPGADDNASSISTLLEIAKNMKAQDNNQRSVVFVALSGEEDFRAGSKHLANRLRDENLADKIEVLNIEMLAGKAGNVLDYWKENAKLTKKLVNNLEFAAEKSSIKTKSHSGDIGYNIGSDAEKFCKKDIPAITVCWNYDAGKGHPNLHSNMDTFENVNPDIFTKASKAVAAISYAIANSVPEKIALRLNKIKKEAGNIVNKIQSNKVA